jgi:hypothetical protein
VQASGVQASGFQATGPEARGAESSDDVGMSTLDAPPASGRSALPFAGPPSAVAGGTLPDPMSAIDLGRTLDGAPESCMSGETLPDPPAPSQRGGLPFGAARAPGAGLPFASSAQSVRSKAAPSALPFASSTTAPLPPSRGPAPRARPHTLPFKRPGASTPSPAAHAKAPAARPSATPAAEAKEKHDPLASTMSFDGGPSGPSLPFAALAPKPRTGAKARKRPSAQDHALPFAADAPAASKVDDDPLAGTMMIEDAPSGPMLTLGQFASLAAEVAMHPDAREAIEARYGLDAKSHDEEKRAWAMKFLQDRGVADDYTAKVKAYREWLKSRGG